MIFTGSAEHGIDEKNRLAIPSKFRHRLDPEHDGRGFYITIGRPKSTLWIYTEREFERQMDQRGSEFLPDEGSLRFNQGFFPQAEFLEPDTQGRIVIPERLMKKTGLPKEIVICGVVDHLEIRRRDTFEGEMDSFLDDYPDHLKRVREVEKHNRRQIGPETGPV